jgi:hypothetical protein
MVPMKRERGLASQAERRALLGLSTVAVVRAEQCSVLRRGLGGMARRAFGPWFSPYGICWLTVPVVGASRAFGG